MISLKKFGAFVQVAEDVEGMIHVGDISAEKRINHPQEVLKQVRQVKAPVLEMDAKGAVCGSGMKQLVPTSLDEYIAEHKEGDMVTGRVIDVSRGKMTVELGEGVRASCRTGGESREEKQNSEGMADLSALGAMLANKWKTGRPTVRSPEERAGKSRTDPQLPDCEAGPGEKTHRAGTGELKLFNPARSFNSIRYRSKFPPDAANSQPPQRISVILRASYPTHAGIFRLVRHRPGCARITRTTAASSRTSVSISWPTAWAGPEGAPTHPVWRSKLSRT